jgi:hypothetical protein
MEYACEVLTDTQSGLRELEYESINGDTQKFVLRVVEPDRNADQPPMTTEEVKRRNVLKQVA